MRIALLADIHGNPIALEAVIQDIQAQGVDAYWILGDIVAIGHDPNGVLERLTALPEARFVRGNTDRYVVTGERPPPTFEEVQADPSLLPQFVEVIRDLAWTQGVVTVGGWLAWLAALPPQARLTLPDGTRLLAVHAAPGRDDGPGLHPGLSEAELKASLSGCEADLVCVGHTHWPLDVNVGGVRLVNPGSVSNPWSLDLRASYAILEAGKRGYQIKQRYVDYDHQAVIAAVQRVCHPASKHISRHMLGQYPPSWNKD
jgi:predicted phosphodiesterase